MKKLIDYYNENYTKKKEYICKDLKPVKWLTDDEYYDFQRKSGIHFEEISYHPLFKIIGIGNFPKWINYVLKVGTKEIKGYMWNEEPNSYVDYNNGIFMTVNSELNKIGLNSYEYFPTEDLNCSLTLYINSFELPKLEYPKNKMDMYRAYNFINIIVDCIDDPFFFDFIEDIELPYPNNIDEINLYFDDMWNCDSFNLKKNAYFINPDKDNYYTVLDAIKKGKTIYKNLDTPLVNWSINKEEKMIKFNKNIAIVNETGWRELES